jgi:hypothetical protein
MSDGLITRAELSDLLNAELDKLVLQSAGMAKQQINIKRKLRMGGMM